MLSACAGGASTPIETPRATSTPAPAPTTPLLTGSPKAAVEAAVSACRIKDGDLLSRLVVGGATDAELAALFDRGIDVRLRSVELPAEGQDAVSIDVGLLIQRESGTEEVERSWELERQGDIWRFTTLPNCF